MLCFEGIVIVIDVVTKLADDLLRQWMIGSPLPFFFPKVQLGGDVVFQMFFDKHGFVLFADAENMIVSSKVVDHHRGDKSIHRVDLVGIRSKTNSDSGRMQILRPKGFT
jgi:hypothetical protein